MVAGRDSNSVLGKPLALLVLVLPYVGMGVALVRLSCFRAQVWAGTDWGTVLEKLLHLLVHVPRIVGPDLKEVLLILSTPLGWLPAVLFCPSSIAGARASHLLG